jgi:UDP:flavonoid glycosyltransferase YjiC (YdhE family)
VPAIAPSATSSRRRILFVAENVTLAQCVRLVTLGRALDHRLYEVHFACSEFPELVFAGTNFVQHRITSLSPEAATRALEAGQRLYEKADLLRYIDAERRLMEAVEPALVIGDFRLSLSTSAELMGVPSAVLINAYWSPFARRSAFPVPDHPIIGWLGESLTQKYFPQAIPHVFRHFAKPLDAARARHGLGPVGGLLEMLTHGDHTLYPDDPWLTPVDGAPSSHRYLGPVLWQPEWQPDLDQAGPPPSAPPVSSSSPGAGDLWYGLDPSRPRLYVTLGSSGALRLVPMVVEALAHLPVVAVIATAGRIDLGALPPNLVARPFVRGADLARTAQLVIFNGGSTTGYQALSQGTKVLGLPSNFDQYLAMDAIERAGAGLSIKARQASSELVRRTVERALLDGALEAGARSVAEHFAQHDSAAIFRRFVAEACGPSQPASAGLVGEPEVRAGFLQM